MIIALFFAILNIFLVKVGKKIYNVFGDFMSKKKIEDRIEEVLNKIRPYMQMEGGDVEFSRYENGVVYVKLKGACLDCPMSSFTLDDVVEEALTNEIEEVIKVVNEID